MKRCLSLLLALVMVLLALAACKPNTPVEPDAPPADDPAQPSEPSLGTDFPLSNPADYVVIVSEFGADAEEDAARLIRNAINEAHGEKPKLSSDWLTGAPTTEEVAARVEILVGSVDRPESKAAKAEMGANSYLIRVDGNKLIVLGATAEMTLEAANYFVSQILYGGDGKPVTSLKNDFSYAHNDDPVLVDTVYTPDDLVVAHIVATEYPYAADPTGKTDSTKAIQQALDDLYARGGGTVFLPAGTYLVTNTVTVPMGCMLKGDWQDPDTVAAGKAEYGTVILAKTAVLDEKYLADRTRDPLISMTQNCAVDGLTFYYPDQKADDVVKYGYTLYCQAPSCVTINNVTLLNSYRGIGIDVHADDSHELVQIERVRMTALETGVEMYHSTEVGNSVDIRITPDYWATAGAGYACKNETALRDFCRENTVAMQFNGLDDTHLSELYIEDARTAIYMPSGHSTHDYWGVIYDVTIERCRYGIVVESLNGYGGATLAKATIDASEVAVYNSAATGALKMCDVTVTGKGGIVSVGKARTYNDPTDVSSYAIKHATYEKPVAKLYVAPVLPLSKTTTDVSKLIQATLDEAGKTGGIVFIPAGIYSIYETVTVPAGVELRGAAPFFMRDSNRGQDGVVGTVLLTYVADDATVKLNARAGVNGLRIFCGDYNPEEAKTLLENDDVITQLQSAIKGLGEGVYAHNVTLTTTFNGIDFTGCDNFSVKQAFGAVWNDFILGGGRGGVIEQCLTNQHFISRQHFSNWLSGQHYSGWTMDSETTATVRDEIRRVYGDMVHLIDAEDVCVSNIFTYGPRCLVLCENSSATLLNTSSDFHGMGPMFDIRNGSDVVAVNALRSANESIGCDESSDFVMINRIAISRYNEPNFDSSAGNVDAPEYSNIRDKVMINDGSKAVSGTVAYTGTMSKTGGNALYHAASATSAATVTLYDQALSGIRIDPYMTDNGYLHLWVYVEDMTSSIWSGWIVLSSSGGSQRWSNICYITHNGWNELWLPLTGASGSVSGTLNRLTITDQRSVKVEHSDFYFDDIYVCNADSDNPETVKKTAAMTLEPRSIKAPALPEEDAEFILTCDSLYGNKARTTMVRVLTDPADIKQGAGAWMLTGTSALQQTSVTFSPKNISRYMKHGYLHAWIYVEDVMAVSNCVIELTSSGANDAAEISWFAKSAITKNGWNELLLPLSAPDSTTGTFAPAGLNYIRVYLNTYRDTRILIDDVRVYLPPDAPAADAPDAEVPDKQTYSFAVNSEEEKAHFSGDAAFNASTVIRFSDNTRHFTYSYYVGDFSKIQGIKWSAPVSGQLLLEVSTDEVNWTEVYRYESNNMADQGLARETRAYNLTDFVKRDAKSGHIYVRIGDSYNENGFGGAISAAADIEMVIYYVPVDPSELGEAGGGATSDIPDVLPATETHTFYAGQPMELSYLTDNNNSSLLYGKRFADATRWFTYSYPIYDFERVTELVWTATTAQELHLQLSTDGQSWVDIYKYVGADRGLAEEARTYDLLPLIASASGAGKIHIRVSDSMTEGGWGGSVSSDAPVTLKVCYKDGEGVVEKGGAQAPTEPETPTFDPDNLPVAETPIPEGEVSDKLAVHGCETLDGSDQRYVPVTLNTDKTFVKEGAASWKREGTSLEYISVRFDAMDISDYMQDGYLHMWVFVTDYNLVNGGQIELTSSGSCDKNEYHWNVTDYITGTGWNEVFVPLSGGTENNPGMLFDPTCANFIRVFCGTSDGMYRTMYFDDIYFCKVK
ncbi:MAG: hypothetical protein J6R04_05870 [Clostridia bacterium]|nr:hypothetical protein [Clostridia bacterium]